MKQLNKVLITFVLLAGVVVLAVPTGSVFAQGGPPPDLGEEVDREPRSLEELYADLIKRYLRVGERLDGADRSAMRLGNLFGNRLENRLETGIKKLIENGEDASGLQAILDTFQANMDAVRSAYDDLGVVVETHAGFDADGAVVDESLAVQTLRQIAEGLLDLHQLGEDARFELRWDSMEYRFQDRVE